jgi:site-specific DNA-methyltransferase (adenine-specific)
MLDPGHHTQQRATRDLADDNPHETRFARNLAQRGDALDLLRALPDGCAPLVFQDPQYRAVLDKLKFGNEGARQSERCALPQMTDAYIEQCCREIARVLRPSGYCMLWTDTFNLCQAHHLRIADVLPCVDLIAWDNLRLGQGYRSRRRGDYLLVLQKPPLRAKATWRDHAIPNRWPEKVDRGLHPHVKPIGLITRLIGAVTAPGDLIVDPAAGSFVVMTAAHRLERAFIGCDIAYNNDESRREHVRSSVSASAEKAEPKPPVTSATQPNRCCYVSSS